MFILAVDMINSIQNKPKYKFTTFGSMPKNLYHITRQESWDKIQKTGKMLPFECQDDTVGCGIFFMDLKNAFKTWTQTDPFLNKEPLGNLISKIRNNNLDNSTDIVILRTQSELLKDPKLKFRKLRDFHRISEHPKVIETLNAVKQTCDFTGLKSEELKKVLEKQLKPVLSVNKAFAEAFKNCFEAHSPILDKIPEDEPVEYIYKSILKRDKVEQIGELKQKLNIDNYDYKTFWSELLKGTPEQDDIKLLPDKPTCKEDIFLF